MTFVAKSTIGSVSEAVCRAAYTRRSDRYRPSVAGA
jgi:hypothetical protein